MQIVRMSVERHISINIEVVSVPTSVGFSTKNCKVLFKHFEKDKTLVSLYDGHNPEATAPLFRIIDQMPEKPRTLEEAILILRFKYDWVEYDFLTKKATFT